MWKRCFAGLLALALLLVCLPAASAAGPEIAAPSAILIDAATGTVLYEKNANERLRPASVTKVMTLLLVMEALSSGRIGWDDMVITSDAAAGKGGSQVYLEPGEQMSSSPWSSARPMTAPRRWRSTFPAASRPLSSG